MGGVAEHQRCRDAAVQQREQRAQRAQTGARVARRVPALQVRVHERQQARDRLLAQQLHCHTRLL